MTQTITRHRYVGATRTLGDDHDEQIERYLKSLVRLQPAETLETGRTRKVEGNSYCTHDTVIGGCLNAAAHEIYRKGQCHALALALWEITGWSICWVGHSECANSAEHGCASWRETGAIGDWCGCQVDHLAVLTPDGELIDIGGPWDPNRRGGPINYGSKTAWGRLNINGLHWVYTDEEWCTIDLIAARSIAQALLEEINDEN